MTFVSYIIDMLGRIISINNTYHIVPNSWARMFVKHTSFRYKYIHLSMYNLAIFPYCTINDKRFIEQTM